ncbi:hypothetical protein Glove_208g68 [Diversispora epigaea]|uniref:Orc1-like AAA ATPase domain-containing protein n=1 Tax=Diversispora epigaea TaxID=1348612 RepID=A0A397IS06_9GLOM|nr:hypothetical protein Glove_208g68 [Diversispora epigaea]
MTIDPQLKKKLLEEFPGRTSQIDILLNWFGKPDERTPPTIFIHGNRALGKTELIKRLFALGFTTGQSSFVNCRICYTPQQVFEYTLKHLAEKRIICKNINDFTIQIQELCENNSETKYLIFDNAELLWKLSSTLVPALLAISQWTNLNICVILISQVPWEKFRKIIGIPEPKFVENICDVFFENCDLLDLIRLLPGLFEKFIIPVNEERATRNDISFLCNELKPYLESALDNLYLQNISNNSTKPEEQMPKWSLYLLIATYLGSYVPKILDKEYFAQESTGKKRKLKKKKLNKSPKNPKKLTLEKKGPQLCEMERVLAIFHCIYFEGIIQTFDIQMQIESFVTHRLLIRTSSLERLEDVSYRCNVSLNCINQIAQSIGFDLSKYLDHDI